MKLTKNRINQVGPVQIRWNRGYREWVVRIPWNREADYFTDDANDAMGTALMQFASVIRAAVVIEVEGGFQAFDTFDAYKAWEASR